MYVFFVLGKQKESSDKVLVKGYDLCSIASPVAIGDNQPHDSCAHVIVSEKVKCLLRPRSETSPIFPDLFVCNCQSYYVIIA